MKQETKTTRLYKVNYKDGNPGGCFLVTIARDEEEARKKTRAHIKAYYSHLLQPKVSVAPPIEIELGDLKA